MITVEEITIIIPVYNEGPSLQKVLLDIQENYYDSEIIVINDGSTDDTINKIKGFNVKVIQHHINKGYGAALKSGIKLAKNNIIISIDADGEHDVKDIKSLLRYIDSFDMVVGKRVGRTDLYSWKNAGRRILNIFADIAVGFKIPDINSGLRIYKKSIILKYLDLLPDTFSFTTTSTVLFIFNMHRIKFVPVNVYSRKGSKVSVKSGFISLIKILILSFLFKPSRGILLLLYILGFCLLSGECILMSKFLGFLIVSFFGIIIMMDRYFQCDKNLISS